MSDWNTKVIAEFRANAGRVAQFGDSPLVILRTVGARTGDVREIPLVAMVDGDVMYVFASKAGAQTNPDWYHNLKSTPAITVEFGTETFPALLTELPVDEGQAKLAEQAKLFPAFGEYVTTAAPRKIPVFSISRVTGGQLDEGIYQLAQGPNFAVVTTLNANGSVQAQPLWIDSDQDFLLVNTEMHRHRVKNLQRDPNVTVCIVSSEGWMHWGEVRGQLVEIITGQVARDHIDQLSMKYTGKPYANPIQSERVILKIKPERQVFINWS